MTVDANLRPPIAPVQPGAYSTVDATNLSPGDLSDIETLAVLGATGGGPPNVPLMFFDAYTLRNRLRFGAAYDCARLALGAGAAPVVVVRVGAGILQSTKALAGATLTPVTLTSIDYGADANNIKVTVAANNVITITYTDSLTGATFTETFDAGAAATAAQVAAMINGQVPGVSASAFVTAVSGAGTMPLAVAAISNMAAGSDGTIAGGDWTTALVSLETEDIDVVVAATGDATVHAQVKTHCDNMSTSLARKERTQIYGGVKAETVATAFARAVALNHKRSQQVYPGIYEFSDAGVSTLYDPFYAAAKEAGYKVAQRDPSQSRIHGSFGCLDVEKRLSTLQGSDLDQLLRNGVAPIAPNGRGFWLVDDLSTAATDQNWRDFPRIRNADVVARRARQALEAKFVGKKNLLGTPGDLRTFSDQLLEGFQLEELIRAWQPTDVTPNGATGWNVSLKVMLVDTNKFIYITVALLPSSTVNRSPVAALS